VVVPLVVVDLQAGSGGLDWQAGLLTEKSVVTSLSKPASKYGKSKDAGGTSVVVPIIVCDLQNGASGEVVQIALFLDPASVGREPDGIDDVLVPFPVLHSSAVVA
jgi:hypothetical protein